MREPDNKRCCRNCVFAERPKTRWLRIILSRWPGLLICFHCATAPGELCETAAESVCPNFRRRRRPTVRTEPPQPPSDDIRYIPLTRGKHAIVDAADYPELSKHKWYTKCDPGGRHPYACRKAKNRDAIYMHRQIMNAPRGMEVDHIDGNTLNNRRSNLRLCTRLQNAQNRRRHAQRKRRFTGVYPCGDKWVAEVTHARRDHYVGRFDSEVEAARAWDRKKFELAGEFARLNFPREKDGS
ncbi:MAG: HNH endonuclease [Sedimentisphaerales bacterium]|nr:HNH endonuclease [Sedimentisphaerales bacterium]